MFMKFETDTYNIYQGFPIQYIKLGTVISSSCIAFTMRIAANCGWSFEYCVIILCVTLLPHVYCFSWFPCVYKRMLRWFPTLQVATACFSCSPPNLHLLDPYFIYMYMHNNHCHRATAICSYMYYYYFMKSVRKYPCEMTQPTQREMTQPTPREVTQPTPHEMTQPTPHEMTHSLHHMR